MKRKILFFVPLILLWSFAMAQPFVFPSQWKFIMKDDPAFKETGFNDSAWGLVTVPMGWIKLGLNKEKSIGWYRLEFVLPDSLLKRDLVLFAGAIDDADETYFNGQFVGHTGKFPPNDQTAWDVERKYVIKKEWVKKKNSIAIRVYNGIGDGGILSGRVMLISKTANDRMVRMQLKNKKSFYQLTTSNGLIAAVYNEQTQSIEQLYPHIFSYYDSGIVVQPVLTRLRLSGKTDPLSTSYLGHSHIIEVKYPRFNLYYFSSFTRSDKILYVLARGKKEAISKLDLVYDPGKGKVESVQGMREKAGAAEKYFLYGFADSLNKLPDIGQALQQVLTGSLLEEEVNFMQKVFSSCKIPAGLSEAEKKVVEESIAVLKMSQVADNEVLPLAKGQVLASLRPGIWAICWVRDASFSIEAMSKLGMYTEARKALEFMLKSNPTNQYIHYRHTDGIDYGVGVPYTISVTRYFGNGREESDYTSDGGPNIELDDFGLFLTAFYHYVKESGDSSFFEKWRETINGICDAIIFNIDRDQVIRTESGPWEHHLPGKRFMWTTGVCARGLQLTSLLFKQHGYPAQKYVLAGERLYRGLLSNCFIAGKYIKGNATEHDPGDHHYFDAATFELFANGLISDRKIFLSHMTEYNKHIRAMLDPQRGYIRFNSMDSYENQEWPFAGLRVAVAQKKLGSIPEAKKLIARITGYVNSNNDLVPEILSNDLSMYKGAVPMVGYGAAAYILAILEYYKK